MRMQPRVKPLRSSYTELYVMVGHGTVVHLEDLFLGVEALLHLLQGWGFRVQGLGFRVQGVGCMV